MAELADALDSGSSEHYAHAGSSPVIRTTSERTLLRSDFSLWKNQSRTPSFLLFREKSRSVRLLVCKRTRDGSQSLPTFHDIAHSVRTKTLDFIIFLTKSYKNNRTKRIYTRRINGVFFILFIKAI